jgi:hypothetical protein
MKKFIQIVLYVSITCFAFSQNDMNKHKQVAQLGSEVYADAAWRLLKDDTTGNPNSVPLHIFVHDGDVLANNVELMSLNVFIKNASDSAFGNPINFDSYSSTDFYNLFSSKSQTDAVLDVQSFDQSLPVKSADRTIIFTSDNCSWPFTCTYTNINHRLWYFTLNIPADKLAGFDDVIDIRVDFELNLHADKSCMMRVFRSGTNLPSLPGWYRGDTHFHTAYTDNSVEMGLPLSASKEAAKAIGLQWTTTSDHSCDFDSYGTSMQDNWQRLGDEIASMNQADSDFIFIRGMEVSLNNSNGNVIHMLAYPNDSLPFSMPFLGDGGGDLSATSVTIDDALATIQQAGGFAYAAHPFAAWDKLTSLMNGGVWNVGDTSYLPNNTPIPGHDVVICNDPAIASDLLSTTPAQNIFKLPLKGGQIWNDRNSLFTTGDILNPWNVENSSSVDAFAAYDTSNSQWHYNRMLQGLEVMKFCFKKGLIAKNADSTLNSYKFFLSAGTDAHGSFNYSNTEFTLGVSGEINDNAVGKLGILAYCPQGMGHNGQNILKALRNGHTIMSDGPIITMGLNTNGDAAPEYISGDEAKLSYNVYRDTKINLRMQSSADYGELNSIKLILGTQRGEFAVNIPLGSSQYAMSINLNLDSLVQSLHNMDTLGGNEYYYLRCELSTLKDYGVQSNLYKRSSQAFHCYANPIWIRKPVDITAIADVSTKPGFSANVFPNPFNNITNLNFELDKTTDVMVSLIDIAGKEEVVWSQKNCEKGKHSLELLSDKSTGFWFIRIKAGENQKILKAVKTK